MKPPKIPAQNQPAKRLIPEQNPAIHRATGFSMDVAVEPVEPDDFGKAAVTVAATVPALSVLSI